MDYNIKFLFGIHAQYYLLLYCKVYGSPGNIYHPLAIRLENLVENVNYINIESTNIYI